MNRSSAVLVLGVAVIVAALVGGQGTRAADASGAAVKVAVIDLERTLSETPAGKRADKKFEEVRKAKQADLDKKKKEFVKYKAELEKQASVLKPEVLKEKAAELEKKYMELQELAMKLERDLVAERTKLLQELLKQARPHVESLAKSEGVHVIVDASAIVWADKAIDLTDKLNAKMK